MGTSSRSAGGTDGVVAAGLGFGLGVTFLGGGLRTSPSSGNSENSVFFPPPTGRSSNPTAGLDTSSPLGASCFAYFNFSASSILFAKRAGGFFATFLGYSPYSGNSEKSNFFPPTGRSSMPPAVFIGS